MNQPNLTQLRHCNISSNSNIAHIATFPPKNRSDTFLRILEGIKGKDLRKFGSNATDEIKTCDDTKKRCCELIIDIFSTKVLKANKKVQKKRPSFVISVFFRNKRFDYINLSSILYLDNVKNLFPDQLKIDEALSVVYSLGKTINKVLNYQESASSIDANDDTVYGTGT